MIKNERQFRITTAQANRFRAALAALEETLPKPGADARLRTLEIDAVRSQLKSLERELDEYNALVSGDLIVSVIKSLDDVARGLIQARIAAQLTHKALANRVGMKEQQIQRYEATDYESASLARIQTIADVLQPPAEIEFLMPSAVDPRQPTRAPRGRLTDAAVMGRR